MFGEVISAAALVLVAIIEMVAARERRRCKDDRARSESRADNRAHESRLAMKLADANLDLSLATALAVEQGKLNGEMKAARAKAKNAQDEYNCFMLEIASHQVAKI